jgi:ribonuclease HII
LIFLLDILLPADSKTLKEQKREELFEDLKVNESIGWAVDIIDPRELSAKMLNKLVQYIIKNFSVP